MHTHRAKLERARVAHDKLLAYQLDCLKIEIDLTDKVLARMESITQSTKNWAIVIWAGINTALLAQESLRPYAYLAAIPVALFWFIDAWWLHLQRGAFVRQRKIAEFLNEGGLERAMQRGRIDGFELLDPYGERHAGTPEHRAATSVLRILAYGELLWLYGGLITMSLIIAFLFRAPGPIVAL